MILAIFPGGTIFKEGALLEKTKGRKRHLLVDTLGLLMVVVVTGANLPERAGAKLVFAEVA